ncbi:MAG: tRNA (guanosine(37)-N1)-methyltransferase TrmD [Christensenellales bacterium]
MRIDILTLFPGMFAPVFGESMLKRAVESGVLQICLHDIREYTQNKHRKTDDYPFGGGSGMIMMAQPVFDCMNAVMEGRQKEQVTRVYMSPRGTLLTQELAKELAGRDLVILCGHYEGVDQRIIDRLIDMEVSIGDFVTTGGELPAMVLMDCVSRFVPGVLGSSASMEEESFSDGLLEYPQYTRPSEYEGMNVPDVLQSGHHKKIKEWQRQQSLLITKRNRPDLLEKAGVTQKELEWLSRQEE